MNSYKTDIRNQAILSKDMKIIELIDVDYRLLSIFQRLDIQLPYGDISIEEMCRRYDMSLDLFLTICKIYIEPDYRLDVAGLEAADLSPLLKYLKASHRYYIEDLIPRIAEGIEQVLQLCEPSQRAILQKFYGGYVDEVREHLQYEETEMFPYVERVISGDVPSETDDSGVKMADFVDNHTDICDKIDDIKSIVIKYLPERCSTRQRCNLLFDIFALREELAKHTMLEMMILAPVVINAEKTCGR